MADFRSMRKKSKNAAFCPIISHGVESVAGILDNFASLKISKNIAPFPCNFNFLGTIHSDFFNVIIHAFPQFLISSLKQSSGLRQMCFLYLVFFLLLEQPLLLLLFFLQLLFQLFLTFKKLSFLLKEIFFSKFTFSILFIKLKILVFNLRQ